MQIIIPKSDEVKDLIICMVDIAGNEELNENFDKNKRWTVANSFRNFDNFLFAAPKSKFVAKGFKGLKPTYKNIKAFLELYSTDLLALPYFEEMKNFLNKNYQKELEKNVKERDPRVFLAMERLQNLKKCSKNIEVISMEKHQDSLSITKPLWKYSSQSFLIEIKEDNTVNINPAGLSMHRVHSNPEISY